MEVCHQLPQSSHSSTTNNQRLGSVVDDLDPRLSPLWQVGDDVIRPCKICGGYQLCVPRSIHLLIDRLSHTISTPIHISNLFFLRGTQQVNYLSLFLKEKTHTCTHTHTLAQVSFVSPDLPIVYKHLKQSTV